MLGKRPRPLLRTPSKMQLMPDDNFVTPPAIEPLHEKPKPVTPVFGVQRQVIGFNPIRKEFDAVGSPRSVLPNVGIGCSQVKSPRSPRSGLESLLSAPRPWEKRGSNGVGLGIVAALSNPEDDAGKYTPMETSKPLATNIIQQQPSPKQSEPIPIGLPYSLCATGKNDHLQGGNSHDGSIHDSLVSSLRSPRPCTKKHEHSLFYGTLADAEMGTRESIFSTASPASSWSDSCGLLVEIDFLNACYFCKRQLPLGKDIYMYRGDRAFCSVECRYQQIVLDERKERCSASVASTSAKHRGRLLNATPAAAA